MATAGAGMVSSERLLLSLAIALALLSLACTLWGCRGRPGPKALGQRGGGFEGYADSASATSETAATAATSATVGTAETAATVSGPAPISSAAGTAQDVVASSSVVVPPLKNRDNESNTQYSDKLEERILEDLKKGRETSEASGEASGRRR